MRIIVFGASGATGRQVVDQALARGISVTAFVRDPVGVATAHADLAVVVGSLQDDDTLARAVVGHDAVISALGVGRPLRRDPAVVDGIGRILEAMRRTDVRRIIYLSFVGVGASRTHAGPVIRHLASKALRNEIADHERKEQLIAASHLDWTILRAPKLTNRAATGGGRIGEELTAGGMFPQISRADVARVMLDQLTDPEFIDRAPSLFP